MSYDFSLVLPYAAFAGAELGRCGHTSIPANLVNCRIPPYKIADKKNVSV